MDFELSEEQKQIKELVKDFTKEVDSKRMKELSQKVSAAKDVKELRELQPLDLVRKMHEVGLRQLAVPERFGGGGVEPGGNVTRTIASEQAGYSWGLLFRELTGAYMICKGIAANHTTEKQKEWFFSQFMANPTFHVAGSISEPQGATDLHLPYDEPGAAMKVFARKDGNEWVINGDKMFCSGGGVADVFMVATRTDKGGPISQSETYFWVQKDAPGLSQILNRMTVPELVGNVQSYFDNVRVPDSSMCGELNKGHLVTRDIFATKWIHFAGFLGDAQRIYDQTVEYAKQRVVGGRPLIQQSVIANMLGDAAIKLEAARAFIYRAAWENDQREKVGGPVNLFWTHGSFNIVKQIRWLLCEVASEVYGGVCGSVDLPIETFVRSTFVFRAPGNTVSMNAIESSMEYNKHKIG
jgi:alkylation response protein AidB-like acyl-CoA dehydrogenase